MSLDTINQEEPQRLERYLSPLAVWALSFGCAVGWGAFVMPGTTFLPAAGPLGTALGIGIGAVVILIIGINYHYLMNLYDDVGGTLTYSIRAFGYDHGFLSAWFLMLVYIAIMWANATALALIGRKLMGKTFQFGFHYTLIGYDIYLGEVLLSMAAILLFGVVCIVGKRLAVGLQILFALLLFLGIIVCAIVAFTKNEGGVAGMAPAFSDNGKLPFKQVFTIIALSPWAYVGFESVSNSREGFRFSAKKTIWILAAALAAAAISYILLELMAVSVLPEKYTSWTEYVNNLDQLDGLKGLPTFFAVHAVLGKAGMAILGVTVLAGIITGLIGNYIAASRLMYTMSKERILSEWFGRLSQDGTPKNALLFLMAISMIIPFFGRTAIGWIVDVNTVGATIAYGYTSAAAMVTAKREENRKIQMTGALGLAMSVFFFFYFMSWSAGAMSTESYLILAFWSILGFIYFRYVFSKDTEKRFGKSTVVWIGLLFLIFFTSLMWVKQATEDMTERVVSNISEYYEEQSADRAPEEIKRTEQYLAEQLEKAERLQTRNSLIQMGLIVVSLGIMFSIYTTISKREKQMEVEKFKALESSKAKSTFLSNMSHDIRTPMNAIIGYINLAERKENDLEQLRTYLAKIKTSSHHLLALINDVLEMSRIESGKMDLEPIGVNLKKTLAEVEDMFSTQMEEKEITFTVDSSHIRNSLVYCDKNRFNRVLLNLLSNAYKFTPKGGTVSVKAWQIECEEEGYGQYELRVTDSGIGMTKEFAEKVFEAFEREKTSTVSGIQGTGLGMAITKSIIDLMGGTIEVNTSPGAGTEFIIRIRFQLQSVAEQEENKQTQGQESGEEASQAVVDFSKMRVLLTEDIAINREIAVMLLEGIGFTVETAENGKEAVDKVSASQAGYYDAVLMDIQMPVMDGYEATKNIRALENPALANVPIIAMTANAFSEDVKKAHDAGMNAHIAKPIDVNTMTETLQAVLG